MCVNVRTLDDAADTDGRREGSAPGGAVELLALFFGLAGCAQPSGVPVQSQLHLSRFIDEKGHTP